MKKIIITGATGTIGRNLAEELFARGDEVTIFTRNPEKSKKKFGNKINIVKWDYTKPDEWKEYLNRVDIVVHLAGANLGAKRWSEEYKKLAYESRILSTRSLIEAIKSVEQKPKTFISANAVGIYGNRYDEILDETSTLGNDFLANLCIDWENEVGKVQEFGVRWVSIRTGLVLIKDEGVLKKLLLPFRLFIGGPLGNGKHWVPWLHIDDIIGIYLNAIDNENINGPLNAASKGIVTMREFARHLGKVLKRPSLLSVPKFAIKLVAGELGEYVVMSQRISVDKILDSGYKFKYASLEESLRDLLK